MNIGNNINTEIGKTLYEKQFCKEQQVATGSNYMFGNGYLGYRGTFCEDKKEDYVACIVTDTYDNADGKWQELCNAPNGFYTQLSINDIEKHYDKETEEYERKIDFIKGIFTRNTSWKEGRLEVEKFASLNNIHLLTMKYQFKPNEKSNINITTGIDGDVWSINGEHFDKYEVGNNSDYIHVKTVTKELGIELYVVEYTEINGDYTEKLLTTDKSVIRQINVTNTESSIELVKYVAIFSSSDVKNPYESAVALLNDVRKKSYKAIKEEHICKWEEYWHKYDIEISGNIKDQLTTRFNLFHNIIHTPVHKHLPVGARGLSCQAYQGAAFWDQEIFNMPMYLYTYPKVARNILEYRYHTIQGARNKAKKLGYLGAFYAWVSGNTGEELCPDFFFKDVLTGRKIRNHFNVWQIHISPDIAYAILKYVDVTEDRDFLENFGLEMLLDIALFLYSRASYNSAKNRYEFIRLLGPDEYHENVDNNIFTNYQSRYVITRTLDIFSKISEDKPELTSSICKKLDITAQVINTLEKMSKLIYIKEIDKATKLIEQFDGYFNLEDTTPDELRKRLKDKSEYWGWPNGVAVHTQILKQADLVQLFVLHPDFDIDVMKANYDYYEPRTEHGSSLSPAMHSIIASHIGYKDEAYGYFVKGSMIDLNNSNKAVSGGTFIGGIHTASAGAVWQMIVYGFAGFSYSDEVISFNPALPKDWEKCSFNIEIRGEILEVIMNNSTLTIKSRGINNLGVNVSINGMKQKLASGETLEFTL